MPHPCVPRPRDATATRLALLASARRHFARESYENVGLRDIAGYVGVDPALVARYFGGKEQLFKEALRGAGLRWTEGVPGEELPAHLASLVIDEACADVTDPAAEIDCLLILLRSSVSPVASGYAREALRHDILAPIARLLDGETADIRASLSLSVLMGVGIIRLVLRLEPLCEIATDQLRDRLTSLFAVALADRP